MQRCIRTVSGRGTVNMRKTIRFVLGFQVNSEEEALDCLAQLKKKYWDARHHCYAYVIETETEIQRFSDDGNLREPGAAYSTGYTDEGTEKCSCGRSPLLRRHSIRAQSPCRAYGRSATAGLDDAGFFYGRNV